MHPPDILEITSIMPKLSLTYGDPPQTQKLEPVHDGGIARYYVMEDYEYLLYSGLQDWSFPFPEYKSYLQFNLGDDVSQVESAELMIYGRKDSGDYDETEFSIYEIDDYGSLNLGDWEPLEKVFVTSFIPAESADYHYLDFTDHIRSGVNSFLMELNDEWNYGARCSFTASELDQPDYGPRLRLYNFDGSETDLSPIHDGFTGYRLWYSMNDNAIVGDMNNRYKYRMYIKFLVYDDHTDAESINLKLHSLGRIQGNELPQIRIGRIDDYEDLDEETWNIDGTTVNHVAMTEGENDISIDVKNHVVYGVNAFVIEVAQPGAIYRFSSMREQNSEWRPHLEFVNPE